MDGQQKGNCDYDGEGWLSGPGEVRTRARGLPQRVAYTMPCFATEELASWSTYCSKEGSLGYSLYFMKHASALVHSSLF